MYLAFSFLRLSGFFAFLIGVDDFLISSIALSSAARISALSSVMASVFVAFLLP